MEVMEEGNLMDRIRILIQRDLQYYQEHQTVLQESICHGVVGGKLDFPRNASFASVKLVLWWEEEYIAAYRRGSGLLHSNETQELDGVSGGCGGIVKSSDPKKFVSMVTKGAEQLLEHLHVLTQEALDHADLTVLTATLGAAALIKNCIWCYIQSSGGSPIESESGTLQRSQKFYTEMSEALAERLLDLHCRLISLYILQDAESLNWENPKHFFEAERGSFTVQMWWFYMFGTRDDLWNTVPPKIAQRIFSGMLNESLTILAVRYTQAHPSEARSLLLVVDISNILLCVTHLLPSICENVEEFAGMSLHSQSKIIRDIHAKCHELLCCFLLRGAPLEILHKVFKSGVNNVGMVNPRMKSPSPWLLLTAPDLFSKHDRTIISDISELDVGAAIALEFRILLAQPQANWPVLLKIFLMRKCEVAFVVLKHLMPKLMKPYPRTLKKNDDPETYNCGRFLCTLDGICEYPEKNKPITIQRYYFDIVFSIVEILVTVCTRSEIQKTLLPPLELCGREWAACLDRKQVWNLNKPPWLAAILSPLNPILPSIITTLISAVQTGASMYQAMSLTLGCYQQLWDCVPSNIAKVASILTEILPADVHPMGDSVLLQLLISALYEELYDTMEKLQTGKVSTVTVQSKKSSAKSEHKSSPKAQTTLSSTSSFDGTVSDEPSIANALLEALCTIDEDNKHTEQIEEFLKQAKDKENEDNFYDENVLEEQSPYMSEIMASDVLMNFEGKFSLKVLHHFIKHNHNWILQQFGVTSKIKQSEPNRMITPEPPFLYNAFHIGERPFDQILTGEWKPDWTYFLNIPMSLSTDRIWSQIKQRWEFRVSDLAQLSTHDAMVVQSLTNVFKNCT